MYLASNLNWTTTVIPLMQEDFIKRYPMYRDVVVTIVDDKKTMIQDQPHFVPTFADGVKIYVKGFNDKIKTEKPIVLASVNLTKLDTNCGTAIVANLGTIGSRAGIGKWLMAWVLHILAHRGFTIAIGTTNMLMGNMELLLEKFKWTEIKEMNFVNKRSGSPIKFWRIYLNKVAGSQIGENVPYLT